ncbi:MAG: amidohydrolase family protein [Planctomycetes bacterium]|nr:amidohydrolase family protein [Planctomycetota bacterium]
MARHHLPLRFPSMHSRIPRLLPLVVVLLSLPTLAHAQMRAVALKRGTILTGDGRTIREGTLLFQNGRISRIGKDFKTPFLTKGVSARGKFITPGLIDVWSTLALRTGGGSDDPQARAADGFDRYAADEIEAALAGGVTAVYLPARTRSGVGGLGAVVRLRPGGGLSDIIVSDESALCATLGVDPSRGPLARVKAVIQFRKRWQTAKDYREALEDYEESVEEYEKELKKRGESAEKETPEKEKQRALSDDESVDGQPRRRRRGGGPPSSKADKADGKKDEVKKPKAPPRDRKSELLLRVIDGELPLRVEVHRPEDILNLLAVSREFNLRLIIEGGSGAYLLAEKLAEADVPVILGSPSSSMRFDGGPRRYATLDAAARLSEAGVTVYQGSGPNADTRNLLLLAAQRVAQGLDRDAALRLITLDAAKLLGLDGEMGRLARGMSADFVVWSDHPFNPAARVEQVYIAGVEVYHAEESP